MNFTLTKIVLLLVFAVSLNIIQASAQNSGTLVKLSGAVVDEDGTELINATILIYDASGFEMITGAASDISGFFTLTVEPGVYELVISYIGHIEYRRELEVSGPENMDLGTIELESKETGLEEVVIESERSQMEMYFDSRVFNVAQDITSLGGSALDVLDHVPSISTDFEGNVSLRGNEGVQILINGRPSSLVRSGTDALSSIPASMIKQVKVITNPSARYSADGTAGIIDIILVDDVQLGLNGGVRVNTGIPQDHGVGVNLNYHVNNINWFVHTDLGYERDPESGTNFLSFNSADTLYAFEEATEGMDKELEGRINLGADIFLHGNQILTAETRINLESVREDAVVYYSDFDPGEPGVYRSVGDDWTIVQQSTRDNFQRERESDYDLRLQYEKWFNDNRDHQFNADIDFEFGDENERSNFTENFDLGLTDPIQQRSFSDEKFRELRIDTDYERPLGDDAKFEAGFRFDYDWTDNNYLLEEYLDGTWVEAEDGRTISNNIEIHDYRNSLYAIFNGKRGPFNFQAGLRAEHTGMETRLDKTDDSSSQNYLNLFPSAFLSYNFNEFNSVQASYSRRISRPRSYMLIPFLQIRDARYQERGNPDLKPEMGNSYELGYLRHWSSGSVLTSVYYRHRTQVIERVSTIDRWGVTTRFPINLATEDAWGIEFSADQELLENLELSGSLNIYQSSREGEYEGNIYSGESETFNSRVRIRWRFLPGWNFQSYMYFQGSEQTTQGRRAGRRYVGAGLSRKLLDDKITISASVRDLFNTSNSDREIIEPESYSHRTYNWSGRSFRIYIRYNFSLRSQ